MREKNKIEWTSILALVISAIALATAIKSCTVSEKSHQLGLQQYQDSFLTIWTGEYIKDEDVIKITPTNKDVVIQRAIAKYPEEISDVEWPIEAPNYYLHITSPKYDIQQIVKSIAPLIKDHYQVVDGARVPVVIEAFYTVNGNNMYDKSLYLLDYLAFVGEEKFKNPTIEIKGLIFGERLNPNIDTKQYINKIWEDGKALNKANAADTKISAAD